MRIEGNCDERGTVEYNLALGQKRADTAKAFLVSLGADTSRLELLAMGREPRRRTQRRGVGEEQKGPFHTHGQ